MNSNPLVSILITPYNQREFIRQTLDSLLMQQCNFEYEILIGEDCSTDGTREICIEYAERHPDRIVLYLNESNKGLIDNYFDLFEKARGTFIADCGGDDYWMSETQLQEQIDLLTAHPDVSIVSGNWLLLDQKTGKCNRVSSWVSEDWYESGLRGVSAVEMYLNTTAIPRISLSASCFRGDMARAFYHKHPNVFRGKDVVCEDLPLTLGLLMQGPVYVSKNVWLTYRVLEKSLSHAQNKYDYVRGFAFNAYRQTLALASETGVDFTRLKPYIYRHFNFFSYQAFMHSDKVFADRITALSEKFNFKKSFKSVFFQYFAEKKTGKLIRKTLERKST